MSDRGLTEGSGADDEVVGALRAAFRAPAGEAYWAALHERIVAHVGGGESWYAPFGRWVGIGLAAAAVAMTVAGVALERVRDREGAAAYQAVIGQPHALAARMVSERSVGERRDATLRFVIEP